MTLEEMEEVERKAGDIVGYCDTFGIVAEIVNGAASNADVRDVAVAVLRLLPVVRAAEAVRAATPCESAAEMRERGFHATSCDLVDAIDALHEEMRKG